MPACGWSATGSTIRPWRIRATARAPIGRDFDADRLLRLVPDVTLVLDVSDAVRRRASERGADADRYERLDAAFHAR